MLAVPATVSKAKPSENTSRKSSVSPRQRLQVEHAQQLGRARIDLQELARMHIHVDLPARLAMSMA
jgi:hypothetical protein